MSDLQIYQESFTKLKGLLIARLNKIGLDSAAIPKHRLTTLFEVLETAEVEDDLHAPAFQEVQNALKKNKELLFKTLQKSLPDPFSYSQFMDQLLLELTSLPPQSKNATDDAPPQVSITASPSTDKIVQNLNTASYKERRLMSVKLLKERFEYNTVKIRQATQQAYSEAILRATGTTRKEDQSSSFYNDLLREILNILELRLVSWRQVREGQSKTTSETNLDLAAQYLAKSMKSVTLSVATLLSDLQNYLDQDAEMLVLTQDIKPVEQPILSSTPHLRGTMNVVSAKNKIMNAINEYSEMLKDEREPQLRYEIFQTLDILKKQLKAEVDKEKYDKLRARGGSFAFGANDPREAYGADQSSGVFAKSDVGAGLTEFTSPGIRSAKTPRNTKGKVFPQSAQFSKKLKSLRKSYGSKAQMHNAETPRGIDGALQEIFIFYSYKSMGQRPGGMTVATEWVISMSDLQRLSKDFGFPISKHRVQDVYKKVCTKGNGFFNNGINFDTFKGVFFEELGREIIKHREEHALQEQKNLTTRVKKLNRKLKEGDFTLNDDDVKELEQIEFEAEIELLKDELQIVNNKLQSIKETSASSNYADIVLDILQVKGDPRLYRMKLPGFDLTETTLANSDRKQKVIQLQKDYEALCHKPRDQVHKFVSGLQQHRLEQKVAPQVDREIKYQKSRQAIDVIHKKLKQRSTTQLPGLPAQNPLYAGSPIRKSVKGLAILEEDEEDSMRAKFLRDIGVIFPEQGYNIRSESNPLKKSIKGSPPQKGAKTGAVPQGLAMSVDLRKKAKKGIDTMGIESVAPSVLGVVNYVSGKKKATMMERARELEKQQKLQNLKSYGNAMKRQEQATKKGLKAVGR